MRILNLILFSVIILASCSVDELPPCEGVGIEGEICKEYQYVFERYNGVNEYSYDLENERLLSIKTKNKKGSELGVNTFSYDDFGRLTHIVKADNDGNVVSETFKTYNEDGDLINEVIQSASTSVYEFDYDDGVIIAEKYTIDSVEQWTDSVEYYLGTEEVYRRLSYKSDVLFEIKTYSSYSNGFVEEKVRNANGVLLSKKVSQYDGENLIEELNYLSDGTIDLRIVYTYSNGYLDKMEKYNLSGTEFEELNYQRF